MRVQHVRYMYRVEESADEPKILFQVPGFRLYLGEGFWDLRLGRNRWRWFW